MIKWVIIFLVIGFIVGVFGFVGIGGVVIGIVKFLFWVGIIIVVVLFLFGMIVVKKVS